MRVETPAPAETGRGHGRLVGVDVSKRTCAVEGCERPHYGRGWCHSHWARWREHGDVRADQTLGHCSRLLKVPLPDLETRFWNRVDRSSLDECWPWLGALSTRGYGRTYDDATQRYIPSHRLSFYFTYGYYPPVVRHSCDNPPCVNPTHLLPGTQRENNADTVRRGRIARGVRQPNAKLTDEQVRSIRARRAAGERVRALGDEFGVHHTQIVRLVARRTWTHVE